MTSLFGDAFNYPSGFYYVPGFISQSEEDKLIARIREVELHPFMFQGFEAKRRVASFGYDYCFDNKALTKGNEIPAAFTALINKVAAYLSIHSEDFAELLVTEYPPGAVINWHRDAPPFDLIAGISLLSDCTFKLRPYDKAKQNRKSVVSIPVERRSLYIIDGESRTEWQHSISPVKSTRYSITLRTLRKAG
jgi:alkylated DNA repair dioxygenase AlkB